MPDRRVLKSARLRDERRRERGGRAPGENFVPHPLLGRPAAAIATTKLVACDSIGTAHASSWSGVMKSIVLALGTLATLGVAPAGAQDLKI